MMKHYKKNKAFLDDPNLGPSSLPYDQELWPKIFYHRSGQVYVLAHFVCQCHVRNMLLSSHNYIRSNTREALSSILTRGKMTSDVFQGTGLTRSEIFLVIKVLMPSIYRADE